MSTLLCYITNTPLWNLLGYIDQIHRAKQGHVPSQVALGELFYWGARGVPRDQVRALAYFTAAADSGDNTARCAAAVSQKPLASPFQSPYHSIVIGRAVQTGSSTRAQESFILLWRPLISSPLCTINRETP